MRLPAWILSPGLHLKLLECWNGCSLEEINYQDIHLYHKMYECWNCLNVIRCWRDKLVWMLYHGRLPCTIIILLSKVSIHLVLLIDVQSALLIIFPAQVCSLSAVHPVGSHTYHCGFKAFGLSYVFPLLLFLIIHSAGTHTIEQPNVGQL